MKFQIVTLPRSGSHMLASAINSHPDITCAGEGRNHREFMPASGDGGIVHLGSPDEPCADKYIILKRPLADRSLSYQRTTSHHFIEMPPWEYLPQANPERALTGEYVAELEAFIEAHPDALVLDYDELTGNKDCREIPEKYGRMICEFLGVDYHPLVPVTYKPTPQL